MQQLFAFSTKIEQSLLAVLRQSERKETQFSLDKTYLQIAKKFVTKGKLLRGNLVVQTTQFYNQELVSLAVQAAVAIELLGSGILIEDDVMDNSDLRRGELSVHKQIEQLTPSKEIPQFGRSGATLLADYLYFLGYDLLNTIDCNPDTRQKMLSVASEELRLLALAQNEDIYRSVISTQNSKEEIIELYIAKTARYSTCWPIKTGAILAGCDAVTLKELDLVSKELGILYQLTDDRVGLLQSSTTTGKPAGGDVAEGKQTLYYLYARQSNESQLTELLPLFGKKDITQAELKSVIAGLESAGVVSQVDEDIANQLELTLQALEKSTLNEQAKEYFTALATGMYKREK